MRKSTAICLIAAFFAVILFPIAGRLLPGADKTVRGENRALASFPGSDTDFEDYPAALEDYLNDHLAYRAEMIALKDKIEGANAAEVRNDVAAGLEGFLYYMADGSQDDILRKAGYSQDQLDRICQAQEDTRAALNERGIQYLLVICPDKHTIYPEYLPEALRGGHGDTRLDQALAALGRDTDVQFVDTRDAVRAAKDEYLVYYKTDTHWNNRGAFAAYGAIADKLQSMLPTFRRVSESDYAISDYFERAGGDMANMLEEEMTDLEVTYTPVESGLTLAASPYIENDNRPGREIMIYENPSHPNLPTAVVFRDSFCVALAPFLAEGFSRVVFVWSSCVIESFVEAEQPDVVLQEYVERLSPGMSTPMNRAKADIVLESDVSMPPSSGKMLFCVDSLEQTDATASVAGWAFLPGRDALAGELRVVLKGPNALVNVSTTSVNRPDVTKYYQQQYGDNLDGSGFSVNFPLDDLTSGTWKIYVALEGEDTTDCVDTGKTIVIE